jgi:hypothetical protein
VKKLLVALGIASLSTGAMAQYTGGTVYQNTSNGHYYQLFTDCISWTSARSYSESISYAGYQGHLATITSQSETDFIVSTFGGPNLSDKSLGGYQLPGSLTKDSGWNWVTGEVWDYTFWNGDTNEPNDNWAGGEAGNENALFFAWNNDNGSWNDGSASFSPNGFLVEYSAPLNPTNNAVPEPSEWAAMGLLGAGLLGLVVKNRKKNLAN